MSDEEAYALGAGPEPDRRAPVVGDLVHYVSHGTPVREDGSQEYGSQCRAAVVTAVSGDSPESVRLCVLSPEGMFFTGDLEYESLHFAGSWHWTHP
jgi:hypothetical protein